MNFPIVQRLSSGYWLVKWSSNQWIQWPAHRQPTTQDGFGWLDDSHYTQAVQLTAVVKEEK